MQPIETIFKNANLFHDRFFNESFQLPYNFESIKIQANDLSTYRVINDAMDRLYDNFLYIYGLTKMASNVIPVSLGGVCAVSGLSAGATWLPASANSGGFNPFKQIGWDFLDNTKSISMTYSKTSQGVLIAAVTDTSVSLVSADEACTSFTVILSSDVADDALTLPFTSVTNCRFIGNYLYVLDSYYNNLYRYNISGLVSDDIYPRTLQIDSLIGGYGIFQDAYKFNAPTSFCTLGSNLYVLDAGNYCIKEYDQDLVSRNVFQYKALFKNDAPLYIEGDNNSGKIFVVTANNLLYIFEPGFVSHSFVDISNIVTSGMTFKNIFSSKAFKNCLYIVTNVGIFKVFITKPRDLIGTYSMYRFGVSPSTILCAEGVASRANTGSDAIYIFTQTSNVATNIIKTLDTDGFVSVLSLPDFDVYTKDDIFVQGGEYTQTWVINKAITKMLLNHLRLKDKIIGRFTGIYDSNGNPLLNGTLYFLLNDLDLTAYQITLDHFAGNNEALASGVINRGLQKIYDLQQSTIAKSNTVIQTGLFENQTVSI